MHRIDSMKRERATAVLVDFCHTKLRFQENKNGITFLWGDRCYSKVDIVVKVRAFINLKAGINI